MVFPNTLTRVWFGGMTRSALWIRRLAQAGDADVFFQPSRAYLSSVGPVPWDVLVAAFDFPFAQSECSACKRRTYGPTFCGFCSNRLALVAEPSPEGRGALSYYEGRRVELAEFLPASMRTRLLEKFLIS